MLKQTHAKLAREIGEKLNLAKKQTDLLESGSVQPDYFQDFPHHSGKEAKTIALVHHARRLFTEGNDECYSQLGMALHYIQDRWTLRPRIRDKHTEWEELIEKAPIMEDSALLEFIRESSLPQEAVESYVNLLKTFRSIKENGPQNWFDGVVIVKTVASYTAIAGFTASVFKLALAKRPTTWSNVVIDLNFAFRNCLEVASNTLTPVDHKSPVEKWDRNVFDPVLAMPLALPETDEMVRGANVAFFSKEEWNSIFEKRGCWNCHSKSKVTKKKGWLNPQWVNLCPLHGMQEIDKIGICDSWKPILLGKPMDGTCWNCEYFNFKIFDMQISSYTIRRTVLCLLQNREIRDPIGQRCDSWAYFDKSLYSRQPIPQ